MTDKKPILIESFSLKTDFQYNGAQPAILRNLRTGETREMKVGDRMEIDDDMRNGFWVID